MRLLSFILLFMMPMFAQSQMTVSIHPGDHVIILDNVAAVPTHFQLDDVSRSDLIAELATKAQYIPPVCEFVFDPQNYENILLRRDRTGQLYVKAISVFSNRESFATNDDPDTQPLFNNGEIDFSEDRFLMIYTPYLKRATSFKISTNNRVLLFIKQYSTTTGL